MIGEKEEEQEGKKIAVSSQDELTDFQILEKMEYII